MSAVIPMFPMPPRTPKVSVARTSFSVRGRAHSPGRGNAVVALPRVPARKNKGEQFFIDLASAA